MRVQWMRADEHGWDPKGPPTLIDLQAGLGADGSVAAWYSQFYIPDGAAGTVALVAADLANLPSEQARLHPQQRAKKTGMAKRRRLRGLLWRPVRS
jgi:hypothetical protein